MSDITASTALQSAQDSLTAAKTITFWGGVSFLVNNITGGGMVLLPGIYQQRGWLIASIALCTVLRR